MLYVAIAIALVVIITALLLMRGQDDEPIPQRMSAEQVTQKSPIAKRDVLSSWIEGVSGPVAGKRFQLGQRTATIGRSPSSFIQIVDDDVSRDHAILRIVDDGLKIIDLQSANGTFLNGVKVTEAMVDDNAEITIGPAKLVYHELAAFQDDSARERKIVGRTTDQVTKQEDFSEAAAELARIYEASGKDIQATVQKSGLSEDHIRSLLKLPPGE